MVTKQTIYFCQNIQNDTLSESQKVRVRVTNEAEELIFIVFRILNIYIKIVMDKYVSDSNLEELIFYC